MNPILQQINPTAVENYENEGAGIGADSGAIDILHKHTSFRIQDIWHCLEIGFGSGKLIRRLADEFHCREIHGIDIAESSLQTNADLLSRPNVSLTRMDASHEFIDLPDDSIDVAFCTETIEHMSNPYFMFANVKRVLKHGQPFVVSFPRPEDNIGYAGGQHAHIYPGFLWKPSWDIFVRQMYFKQIHYHENGSTGWYILANYKGPGVVDVFSMTSGNYTEEQLFGCLENF